MCLCIWECIHVGGGGCMCLCVLSSQKREQIPGDGVGGVWRSSGCYQMLESMSSWWLIVQYTQLTEGLCSPNSLCLEEENLSSKDDCSRLPTKNHSTCANISKTIKLPTKNTFIVHNTTRAPPNQRDRPIQPSDWMVWRRGSLRVLAFEHLVSSRGLFGKN